MYSPPGRPLEKKELGLVSVSPSVCRVGLHTCHSVSHFCLCRVFSTLATVSVHSVLNWVSQSLSVRLYRRHHWMNESIVNGYRRHSQNSCSYLLPLTGVESESSGEHVSPVTTTTSSRASLSEMNVTVHVLFSASTRPTGQLSRGEGGPRSLTWRVSDWSTSFGCCDCVHVLHDGSLCCLSVHCVLHWQYLCLGPEACSRTDATMMLQLYAPRLDGSRRRGWRNLWVVTEEGLALLVIPQLPLHCRPCYCFWCCYCCCCCWWWWWWWWRSQSCRWCCCCGRLCCQSGGCSLSASSAMTHVQCLLCSHRHDCNGCYWWWWWWSLVHIALFSALEQTHCGTAFVACGSIEMSDCRFL